MAQANLIGKNILGYTVSEKLGSGAFGTVYKVIKTNAAGQYVRALKHITIPTEKQYNSVLNSMGGDVSKVDSYFSQMLNNIVSEIRILNDLSEKGVQHIVRYYENDILVNDAPRRYDIFILMEYLTPLEDYIQSEDFLVRDVVRLGLDVLYGLRSCHDNGVIHRDIKDDNIFVSDKGEYKIGDFGVSKVLRDSSKAESLKGTPNFLAPEVYLGKESYTKSVDLYSLGIVLYRLLNYSRNPFLPRFPEQYFAQDEDRAFEERMSGKIPDLPSLGGEEIGRVIVKAISDSAERFQTASEFIKALEAAISGTPTENLDESTKFSTASSAYSQTEPKQKQYGSTIGETAPRSVSEERGADERNSSINKHLFDSIGEVLPSDIPDVEPVVRTERENGNEGKTDTASSKTGKENNGKVGSGKAVQLLFKNHVNSGGKKLSLENDSSNGVSINNTQESGAVSKEKTNYRIENNNRKILWLCIASVCALVIIGMAIATFPRNRFSSDDEILAANDEMLTAMEYEIIPTARWSGGFVGIRDVNGNIGLMDINCNIAVPCEYDDVHDFSNGFYAVCKDKKWGYIDESGNLVIDFEYDNVADFSDDGLACVQKNDKYGHIDAKGAAVIPIEYDNVGGFCEGVACVKKNGKWGCLNTLGEIVVPFEYDDCVSCSEGLIGVEKDGKCGYVDKNGNIVIPFDFDWAGAFSDGMAAVRKNDKCGFIDKSGNIIIPLEYDSVATFSEGLAAVKLEGKWGFINSNGELQIPCIYYKENPLFNDIRFKEGLAFVQNETGKYGYIDTNGQTVIPFLYEYSPASSFSNGIAYVQTDNERMLIDKNGDCVIKQKTFLME